MLKPSDISDISEDMLKAYDSKEIKSAKPSQFCSYNYYVQFTELLKSLGKATSVSKLDLDTRWSYMLYVITLFNFRWRV